MIEKLNLDFNYKDYIENKLINYVKTENIPVILYGAGMRADMIKSFLSKFEIAVSAYVVSDSHYDEKMNRLVREPVIKYSELSLIHPKKLIIIATDHLPEYVLNKVIEENDTIQVVTPAFLGMDIDYIYNNEEKFEYTMNLLSDIFSKETFINFLTACLTLNPKYIGQSYCDRAYFIKEINITEEEVFVDAGAFDGDTLRDFLEFTGYKYKKYYGFEPDEKNFEKLFNTSKGISNTNIYKIGLSNFKGISKFDLFEGVSSRFNENGSFEVSVDKIDNLCKDATFIKMDIEGAEMEALLGAETVILRNKPKLAICIYHKKEHLTDIIKYINSLVPEYKFFLRQHNKFNATELVLYGIC